MIRFHPSRWPAGRVNLAGSQEHRNHEDEPPSTHRRPVAGRTLPRLLTLRDVTEVTAVSRSAVYALRGESRFPKPVRIGSRAVRWVEQAVLDFIATRPRAGSERPTL